MITSLHATQVRMLRTAAARIGVALPKTVANAYADLDKIQAAPPITGSLSTVAEAIARATLAGRDPVTDEAVQAAAAAYSLAAVSAIADGSAAESWAFDHVASAISEHSDQIIESLVKIFAPVAERLTIVAAQLEGLDRKSMTRVPAMVTPVLAEADTTEALMRDIIDTWTHVAAIAERTGSSVVLTAHLLTDADPDTLDRLRMKHGVRPDAWALLEAGATLNLASFDEYARRKNGAAERRQQMQDEMTAAARADHRAKFGIKV